MNKAPGDMTKKANTPKKTNEKKMRKVNCEKPIKSDEGEWLAKKG
jgi:hypothetical protein